MLIYCDVCCLLCDVVSPFCHAGVVWILCHANAPLYTILSTLDEEEVEKDVEVENGNLTLRTQLALPSTTSHYTISHHITSSGQSSVIREWQ